MSKITITKDGVTKEIKHRYLENFLDRGWVHEGEVPAKKEVSVKVEATADVVEEETPETEDEDNWTYSLDDSESEPEDEEGED